MSDFIEKRKRGRPRKIKLDSATVAPIATTANTRQDGWKNALSGLGTSVDKRAHTKYSVDGMLNKYNLVELYEDGLVQRIVDVFPDDMTRQWLKIPKDERESPESDGMIEAELKRLQAPMHINTAIKWARLMGGSLLFVGAIDGQDPSRPLNVRRIKSIDYLRVFDLGEIDTGSSTFITDPGNPDFGKIDTYVVDVNVGNTWVKRKIHASRCIEFHGLKMPPSIKASASLVETRYWGLSVIQPAWEYIRDFTGAMGSVSQILYEFVIGKYKLSDLDEILAQGNEGALQSRIQAIEMTKSLLRAVLLGTDEDYTRDSATVTGIPDVLDRFMMVLSAVTGIPVTKLFGRSAAGLNATGENDTRNYYDEVRAKQNNELTPGIQRLIEMVCAQKNINPVPSFKWNPLQQLTEKEEIDNERVRAEVFRTLADGDQRYLTEGVLMPEDIYNLRFKEALGHEWDGILPIDDVDLMEEQAPQNETEDVPGNEEVEIENEPAK